MADYNFTVFRQFDSNAVCLSVSRLYNYIVALMTVQVVLLSDNLQFLEELIGSFVGVFPFQKSHIAFFLFLFEVVVFWVQQNCPDVM